MKVIVIGGYPGSGKSTIMKGVIAELEQQGQKFKRERIGIVSWMESDKVIILGDYSPDEKFPGTDRLPLNVQPDAQRFLLSNKESGKTVVIEGDRLFNDKMLTFLNENGYNIVLCIVFTAKHLLEARRNKRSEQNASWRKGRETKVDRIAMTYPVHHHLQNNTKEEQEVSIIELVQEINGVWKQEVTRSKIKDYWR
jgi:molybdopterin-guanine dinucleotide biosynthesis protein